MLRMTNCYQREILFLPLCIFPLLPGKNRIAKTNKLQEVGNMNSKSSGKGLE